MTNPKPTRKLGVNANPQTDPERLMVDPYLQALLEYHVEELAAILGGIESFTLVLNGGKPHRSVVFTNGALGAAIEILEFYKRLQTN